MSRSHRTASGTRAQLTFVAILKFAVVIGVIVAGSLPFHPFSWLFVFVGGATGMFVAEYFCRTRPQEFIALLIVPALLGSVQINMLFLRDLTGVEPGSLVESALMGFAVSVVPSVISVVAVSIACRVTFRLSGIRFLKFDWADAELRINDRTTEVSRTAK